MGPKQQRGAATVEQVLDCVLDIYAVSGETGVTVSAVTSASGVSAGSVYHHFGSLQGVLAAVAQRWLGCLLAELTSALERAGDDTRCGIEAVVRGYLKFVADHPDAARLIHSVVMDSEAMASGRELRGSQEARLAPLAAWLRNRREAGDLVALPAPVLESLVLGPVTALARRWLSVGDIDLDEVARTVPQQIWWSVGNRP
ncbi:TetR/AcrR family transcriptional regulator [Streptomyces sp. AC512_CC834]|uniref:TetR/AcrR family transcriptional regulator n=1 Tax=Streptomyces sp. AC512_CC834 TaxID=2823691 RepID=UPI001C256211|nr:TetR/AcrR family transcriptional regulator [Streptomyces sp. AC512_CC834]